MQFGEDIFRGKGPLPRPSDTEMPEDRRVYYYNLAMWRLQQRGKDPRDTEPHHLAFHFPWEGSQRLLLGYWETPYGVRANATGGYTFDPVPRCGHGLAAVLRRPTEEVSRGRAFLRCPLQRGVTQCGYFYWLSDIVGSVPEDMVHRP
jgi:hypothetical protein